MKIGLQFGNLKGNGCERKLTQKMLIILKLKSSSWFCIQIDIMFLNVADDNLGAKEQLNDP